MVKDIFANEAVESQGSDKSLGFVISNSIQIMSSFDDSQRA